MRSIVIGAAIATLILIAATIWPTAYSYNRMNVDGEVLPIRVHRLMGITEVRGRFGWLRSIPRQEIAKLDGTAEIIGSTLWCNIYNGSEWKVKEIVVNLEVFEPDVPITEIDAKALSVVSDPLLGFDRQVLDRDYRLSNGYCADPLEAGVFKEYVGFDLKKGQYIQWYIKSAKGEPR